MIRSPTRVTTETSTLIDHVLVNSPEKISQFGVIDSGISDHNIVFCTRKITKEKTGNQRITQFRSYKNYSAELFEEALKNIQFPNYDNFSDIDIAYSDFIFKLTEVIDKMAPMKQSKIKNNTQEWFDEEVAEKLILEKNVSKNLKTRNSMLMKKFLKKLKKMQEILKKGKRKNILKVNSQKV